MVLVEHAAESITPSDVEVADSVRLGEGWW
jgi:hypothetical protein